MERMLLATFLFVTYMYGVAGHFQEVGQPRTPSMTARDVTSTILPGPDHSVVGNPDLQKEEQDMNKYGARALVRCRAKGESLQQPLPRDRHENKQGHQNDNLKSHAPRNRCLAGAATPREGNSKPTAADVGEAGDDQYLEKEWKDVEGPDAKDNKMAEIAPGRITMSTRAMDRYQNVKAPEDDNNKDMKKDITLAVNAQISSPTRMPRPKTRDRECEAEWERHNIVKYPERRNITIAMDAALDRVENLLEPDDNVLMQRRKRGRSPTPRRRRRHREAEAARRAANRARWIVRGTPSKAPAPERSRTSSTRTFPPAPWAKRTPTMEIEEEEVCVEEPENEAAGSSTDAARPREVEGAVIPGLNDLDPRIRWWCDIIGLTNPMNSSEHLNVLSPDTTNTIISNLQGQSEIERARNVRSVLSFVGLFIAELLRAIHEAEHGDRVVLMQTSLDKGPGSFAKILTQLQEDLDRMGKERAMRVAQGLLRHLSELGVEGKGMRAQDRKLRLTALLVVYSEGPEEGLKGNGCGHLALEREKDWLWARVLPFLRGEEAGRGQNERASSSGDAAGALDEDDEHEGILVRRALHSGWEKPTQEEVREIMQHDEELKAEAARQEKEDREAFQRFQASRLQNWEDWAMTTEMNSPPEPALKRVRVVMVLGSQGGETAAEGVMEGTMAADASPMVTMTMSHTMLGQPAEPRIVGPPTPDTVQVPDNQVAEQLAMADAPEDLDTFLLTEHGQRWLENWKTGQVDDDMVVARWGAEVLELFVVTKTIQEDPHALDTQKPGSTDADKKGSDRGSAEAGTLEDLSEVCAAEEEREDAGNAGTESKEQDVMQEDDQADNQDEMNLMQKVAYRDYEMVLQAMLKEMESLAKAKAARLSSFLQQMLIDQRRQSPHLRNPILADRHDRLLALLTVFEAEEPVLREDEYSWCMDKWQHLRPFLENARTPSGQRLEDVPGPSSSQPECVEIIDSQERTEEEGSKKRVVQLEDGTQRNLTEKEEQEMLENELMEEIAAEELREEERLLWRDFHAAELRAWESWAAASEDFMQGRKKRARVQILVQGQGGRIIKKENWLVGLGSGERLSYSVSVVQDAESEDDLEKDPTATSSERREEVDKDTTDASRAEAAEAEATLPVTGEQPAAMWNEENASVAKDIDVDDFMCTPLAEKFYGFWRQGTVTDRLVGQRFGYGVLGRFYSQRLWDQGCFDGMEEEGEERATGSGLGTTEVEDNVEAAPIEHAETVEEANVDSALPEHVAEGVDNGGSPAVPEDDSEPAASSASAREGSAAASTRPTEAGDSTGVLSGSRQTSLAHWLL